MSVFIVAYPDHTEPYRPPNPQRKFCPWIGDVCAGENCAAWGSRFIGCLLVWRLMENVRVSAPAEPRGRLMLKFERE